MDPKLFYQDFTKAEEKAVESLMETHFADRIHPPPEKIDKKYSLKKAEWSFLAKKLSVEGNKKSAYQVKRTWHIMRRRVYLKTRRQILRRENRNTSKRRRRYCPIASPKRAKWSEVKNQQYSEEEDILDIEFSTTDSLSFTDLSNSVSRAFSRSPSAQDVRWSSTKFRDMTT